MFLQMQRNTDEQLETYKVTAQAFRPGKEPGIHTTMMISLEKLNLELAQR